MIRIRAKHLRLLCLLSCGVPIHLEAQPRRVPSALLGDVHIERMQVPAISIAQDRKAFMWFLSNEGLFRYDGFDYIHYRHNRDDSSTLSPEFNRDALYVDRGGTLWVGALGGLDRYDPESNGFTHFRDAGMVSSGEWVFAILEDHEGTLWLGMGTGGTFEDGALYRFDRQTGTFSKPFRHDPTDPTSLTRGQVRVLYEDRHVLPV